MARKCPLRRACYLFLFSTIRGNNDYEPPKRVRIAEWSVERGFARTETSGTPDRCRATCDRESEPDDANEACELARAARVKPGIAEKLSDRGEPAHAVSRERRRSQRGEVSVSTTVLEPRASLKERLRTVNRRPALERYVGYVMRILSCSQQPQPATRRRQMMSRCRRRLIERVSIRHCLPI